MDRGRKQGAGVRPYHRHRRPLLRDGRAPHPQVGPLGLRPLLHPVEYPRGVAGRRRHQEAVVGQPRDRAVVEHHAVDPAHDPVADGADGERGDDVGVEPVEELARVRADHLDLAQGGRVQDRDGGARRDAFAAYRLVHRLAVARVIAGPPPLADVLELRLERHMRVVRRSLPDGVEQRVAVASRQGREQHRHVRRAERGQLDARAGGQRRQEPGGLALVVRRTGRRVALHVLHRAQPRAGGPRDIGHGHVALQVDVPALRPGQVTGRRQRRHVLHRAGMSVGHHRAERLIEAQPPAGLPVELQHGAEPAGDQHRVDLVAVRADRDAPHPRLAEHLNQRVRLARVHHGGDLYAGGREGGGRRVTGVVRSHHDGAATDQYAVPVQVAHGRRRQHDAGHVVAGERQRPFVPAGGQQDPPGADAPQALAGAAGANG